MAEWERRDITDSQLSYIGKLLQQRKVPEEIVEMATGPLNRGDASKMIAQLQTYPKKNLGTWDDGPTIRCKMPEDGTYTVQFGVDSWRTIRIRKPHPKADFHVAEYLYGPDNSTDFRRFAREVDGGFKLFPSYVRELNELNVELLKKCLQMVCEADVKELLEMGFKYAEKSKRCFRCGRKLTVPASTHRGMGPVCAGKE